ncbi:unnamed protein product [Closterium sp. NIES-65]|nr:unnamed protein product [Closterium sp. NIES-65]
MARSRKSRKGKKEWRRNISTADHDKFLEEKGRDERSGGALDAVPSENIFFVDKSKVAPKLRKVDKWRARESHADAILKRSSLVPPLVPEPSPARAKSSVKPSEKLADKPSDKPANASADKPADSAGVALAPAERGGGGGGGAEESGDGGGGEIVAAASGEGAMAIVQSAGTSSGGKEIVAADSGVAGGKRRAKKARKNSQKPLFDLWADEDLAGNRRGVRATDKATPGGGGEVEERVRRRGDGKMIGGKEERNKPGSSIPAVEIDAPGCSFNPSIEEHQDAIAVAVAEELKESYQAALAPTLLPFIPPLPLFPPFLFPSGCHCSGSGGGIKGELPGSTGAHTAAADGVAGRGGGSTDAGGSGENGWCGMCARPHTVAADGVTSRGGSTDAGGSGEFKEVECGGVRYSAMVTLICCFLPLCLPSLSPSPLPLLPFSFSFSSVASCLSAFLPSLYFSLASPSEVTYEDFFLTQGEEDEEEEEEEEDEDGNTAAVTNRLKTACNESAFESTQKSPQDGNTAAVTKHRVPKRLTRADLNRRMRHKLVEAELAKRRKLKAMRKDLDRLKDLQRELEEEREEAEKRRVRREIARVELRMKRAPRLGRHKFKPEPMSVLTSDQVTGSLRQLKQAVPNEEEEGGGAGQSGSKGAGDAR